MHENLIRDQGESIKGRRETSIAAHDLHDAPSYFRIQNKYTKSLGNKYCPMEIHITTQLSRIVKTKLMSDLTHSEMT